jgi:hypothetical protein
MNEPGRPAYTDEQYQQWLDDMTPFLKLGETLNSAIQSAGLLQHKDSIYRKYRLKDEFCEKIDTFRAYPGKLANNILVKVLIQVDEKMKQGLPVSEDEMKNVRFYAEKSRSAQPYFVNRQETSQTKPIEEILDEFDNDVDKGHLEMAEGAKKELQQNQSIIT